MVEPSEYRSEVHRGPTEEPQRGSRASAPYMTDSGSVYVRQVPGSDTLAVHGYPQLKNAGIQHTLNAHGVWENPEFLRGLYRFFHALQGSP